MMALYLCTPGTILQLHVSSMLFVMHSAPLYGGCLTSFLGFGMHRVGASGCGILHAGTAQRLADMPRLNPLYFADGFWLMGTEIHENFRDTKPMEKKKMLL